MSRTDAELDRLVGLLSRRIARRTGRDTVRIVVDLLQAVDVAGLDPEARLELFRQRVLARQRYCKAEGLEMHSYVDAQREVEVNEAVARISRAMAED